MHGYDRVMALNVMGNLSYDGCLSTNTTYVLTEEGGKKKEGDILRDGYKGS
jgi:hypothetical protein